MNSDPSRVSDRTTAFGRDPLDAARFLFYVNAAVWTALGLATLLDRFGDTSRPFAAILIVSGLMLGNGLIMAWLGWRLPRQRRRYYYAALAWLFANILLTVTDQFGLLDAITMLLDLILVALLILARPRFLPDR